MLAQGRQLVKVALHIVQSAVALERFTNDPHRLLPRLQVTGFLPTRASLLQVSLEQVAWSVLYHSVAGVVLPAMTWPVPRFSRLHPRAFPLI